MAQWGLGVMYNEGQGVPQDYVLAHMWFNLSAAQGNDDGVKSRDRAAGLMISDQLAEALAPCAGLEAVVELSSSGHAQR